MNGTDRANGKQDLRLGEVRFAIGEPERLERGAPERLGAEASPYLSPGTRLDGVAPGTDPSGPSGLCASRKSLPSGQSRPIKSNGGLGQGAGPETTLPPPCGRWRGLRGC